MFRVEEIIVCIDNTKMSAKLTIGQRYVVASEGYYSTGIIDDNGGYYPIMSKCFVSVEEYRNNLIRQILL